MTMGTRILINGETFRNASFTGMTAIIATNVGIVKLGLPLFLLLVAITVEVD